MLHRVGDRRTDYKQVTRRKKIMSDPTTEKWLGISSSSDRLILVGTEFDQDALALFCDDTWNIRGGDHAEAYAAIHDRLLNYLIETHIQCVALKGSALSPVAMRAGNLAAIELRGAVLVAIGHSRARVYVTTKATMSRRFGKRKVDEYVSDDGFWENQFGNTLRKGSRETAMLILNARKK